MADLYTNGGLLLLQSNSDNRDRSRDGSIFPIIRVSLLAKSVYVLVCFHKCLLLFPLGDRDGGGGGGSSDSGQDNDDDDDGDSSYILSFQPDGRMSNQTYASYTGQMHRMERSVVAVQRGRQVRSNFS